MFFKHFDILLYIMHEILYIILLDIPSFVRRKMEYCTNCALPPVFVRPGHTGDSYRYIRETRAALPFRTPYRKSSAKAPVIHPGDEAPYLGWGGQGCMLPTAMSCLTEAIQPVILGKDVLAPEKV
jgi:hypothetical protein